MAPEHVRRTDGRRRRRVGGDGPGFCTLARDAISAAGVDIEPPEEVRTGRDAAGTDAAP